MDECLGSVTYSYHPEEGLRFRITRFEPYEFWEGIGDYLGPDDAWSVSWEAFCTGVSKESVYDCLMESWTEYERDLENMKNEDF